MEAEGRPAKIRKLEHAQETEDATMDDSTLTTGQAETQIDSAPVTKLSGDSENGEVSVPQEGDDAAGEAAPKLSKNQLKKQRRWERWEAGREDRKVKRKEKIKARKERRRTEWEEQQPAGSAEQPPPFRAPRRGEPPGVQVPITILFDCDFEEYMHDHELKSLGLQITRSYSDNRKAPFRCHLGISSWGGKMKERFDGVLAKQYTSWKGFQFCEEDFVKTSEMSKEWMKGPRGGKIAGALAKYQVEQAQAEGEGVEAEKALADADADEEGEVVYLSAESDNTLERLKPNSTYIIGGLVDKNRHKGLCYKRALDRGIKTAKLPIGEFLQMDSRKVLVTNHVLDIMLKWLEHDDWGKAFIEVLPKRKGGVLKTEEEDGDEGAPDGEEEAAEEVAGENVQPIPNSPPPAYEDVVQAST
ncbi:tRNA (guanine(9)-N1)-methyltransferase [Paraphaeosphaeria sporulosa]